MKNINHTRSSISDDIRNILCSSANMRRAIPLILRLLMNRSEERFSRNAETDLVCRLLLEKKKELPPGGFFFLFLFFPALLSFLYTVLHPKNVRSDLKSILSSSPSYFS